MVFNRASRDLDIVERDRVIAELLIIFVTLARNQYNVSWTRERNGAIDRLGAINHFFIPIRAKALFDLGDNRIRIFLARIIGGDDGVVSKAICHLGHERALLPVAIAAAAENRNQALRLELAQSFENVPQRVGRVRIIHEDLELSSGGYEFQPSRHLRRLSETQYSISQVDTQNVGRSQRRYRISHIKPAN